MEKEIIIKGKDGYTINPNIWKTSKRYQSIQDAHDDLIRHLSKHSFNYNQLKTAYHGGIGGGTPTGWSGNWSQYNGNSPMFNPLTVAPQFGGNSRNNFPSGGNFQIDDDSDDKNKNITPMQPEDYHEIFLKNLIDKQIKGTDIDKDGKSYVAIIQFKDKKSAKDFAEKHPDQAKATEYNTVEVLCPSFENALEFEKLAPGVVIRAV